MRKIFNSIISLLFCLSISSCTNPVETEANNVNNDNLNSDIDISSYALFSNPKKYHTHKIKTIFYIVSVEGDQVFFVNRDAAKISDITNAITECNEKPISPRKSSFASYGSLTGTFEYRRIQVENKIGSGRTSGCISHITRVGGNIIKEWSYAPDLEEYEFYGGEYEPNLANSRKKNLQTKLTE